MATNPRSSKLAAVPGARGGRRPTSLRSQYSAQVIAMTLPAVKAQIEEMGEEHGISQSEIARRAIDYGLKRVRAELDRETERRRSLATVPDSQ